GPHGRQGEIHFPDRDHRDHRVHRQRGRHLLQHRPARRFRAALALRLRGRLAGRGGDGIHCVFVLARPYPAHRRPDREDGMMLHALDLARRIDAGELSPADVIDLCAKAIDAREKDVCAFAALDVARAREKAQDAGLAARPLRGLPVGVKDIIDTVDFPTEYGTPVYKGNQPRADAALVALIRRAGGIVLGKMVTTALAVFNPSRPHTPHDVARAPGGSSAGSAASVAAGMLPITVGTQTGGSVIRPASYCGVAALKPSYRLLPIAGIKPFAT